MKSFQTVTVCFKNRTIWDVGQVEGISLEGGRGGELTISVNLKQRFVSVRGIVSVTGIYFPKQGIVSVTGNLFSEAVRGASRCGYFCVMATRGIADVAEMLYHRRVNLSNVI